MHPIRSTRLPALALALALTVGLMTPASAFLWFGDKEETTTPAQAGAPIAVNLSLSTYKNVAIHSLFEAVDSEGDPLTFQMTSTPARGSVTVAEEGASQFVYTPFENKTGKDSFTYVAIDDQGNTSPEATVTIQIEKPSTTVSYADMENDPAHKAALRLAEEGVFVGKQVNGEYYFDADTPVSRSEFLSLAMTCVQMEPLEDISVTGFYDDEAIPTWAKGYVSSALMAGAISGSRNELGQPVFDGDTAITQAEATVVLNQLLNITDVATQETAGHWADQATANLAASGVITQGTVTQTSLSSTLTRGEVAQLLDGALDVLATRDAGFWIF